MTSLDDLRSRDRPDEHDLAVREVDDAAETVDQRHPDPEQAEGQPEHDPVQDDGSHVFSADPESAEADPGSRTPPVAPDRNPRSRVPVARRPLKAAAARPHRVVD